MSDAQISRCAPTEQLPLSQVSTMSDNFRDVLDGLKQCVNIVCSNNGPIKAHERIVKILNGKLESSISHDSRNGNDKASSQVNTAVNAAMCARKALNDYLKAEMEFRIRNKGGTYANQPTNQGALGDYKAADRKENSIQIHIEALIIQGQTTRVPGSEAELQLFEVGTYGDLKSRPRKGMEIDHIPSKAALCEAACRYIEIVTGNPPSKAERRKILKIVESHGGAIVVPKEMHRHHSRTIGGRNTNEQIVDDSLDLIGAVEKDFDYYIDLFEQHGLDATRINVLKTKVVKQLANFQEEIWKRN